MSVRVGTIEDLQWVMEVAQEVGEAPQWGEEDYRRVLERGTGPVRRRVVVWEKVGFAVGMVMKSGAWGEGEIENVVVLPWMRRAGIGRLLCEQVMRWCFEEGVWMMRLEVRVSNSGAIALYKGLGFQASGTRKGYYRMPLEDAVVMETRNEAARVGG